MKKKNQEKFDKLHKAFAAARADKIELLAKVAKLEEEKKQIEEEAEELIGLAAIVGEKLEAARPEVANLRAVLVKLDYGADGYEEALSRAIDLAWRVAEVLTGPIVHEAKTVKCGASATLQQVEGGAVATVNTQCWAEHGHEGDHGDSEGRSW